jgi:O-antigen ligase
VIKNSQILARTLLLALITTSLGVTPFISFEPINIPRFCLLTIFSCALIFILPSKYFREQFTKIKIYLVLCTIYISLITFSMIRSNLPITDGIFGVSGRNTGILTYLGLSVLMITAILSSSRWLNEKLYHSFILIGLLNGIYALIQHFGYDVFDWVNPYSPIIGLLGNPNFLSSYLGMTSILLLNLTLNSKFFSGKNALLISIQIILVYLILASKSIQGLLVLCIGASFLIFIKIRNSFLRKYQLAFVFLVFLITFLMALDIFQKAPWKSFLYKESVSFRGDFWRAGFNMFRNNPILGLGPDSYRDNFRFYRDLTAVGRNSNVPVDSAHNFFIDVASSGGIFLLITYLTMVYLTLRASILIIRRNSKDSNVIGLIALWIAYLAQSIISVGQISILVWGWAISGAIIGHCLQLNSDIRSIPKQNAIKFLKLRITAGILVGISLSYPLFKADRDFRKALNIGQIELIKNEIDQWPQQVSYRNTSSLIMRNAGFNIQALEISRDSVKKFPKNYEAWREIYLNPITPYSEKQRAFEKLKILDPLNPNHN